MGNKIREGIGYERLFLFLLAFCLLCHIVACFWILTTTFRDSESWASSMGYEEQDHVGIYITSYYFIVTTITTVGYGDIVPVTQIEKIFCIVNIKSFHIFFNTLIYDCPPVFEVFILTLDKIFN